jgi:hypothetical protein
MAVFLVGALALGFAAAALFFLRFWRETGDRLFGLFAAAFGLMAVGRLFHSGWYQDEVVLPLVYLVRLAAFVLILVGIADKNRRRSG